MKSPNPEEVKAARARTGLSGAGAAAIVHVTRNIWIKWERGERNMTPGLWELFLIKTNQTKTPEYETFTKNVESESVILQQTGAARFLGVTRADLDKDVVQGNPAPPYIQFSDGERVYRRIDLIKWVRKYRCY